MFKSAGFVNISELYLVRLELTWNALLSLKELAQLATLHDLSSNFLALIQ